MKTVKNLSESLNGFTIIMCDDNWDSIKVAGILDQNTLLENTAIIDINKGIIKVKEWDDNVGY